MPRIRVGRPLPHPLKLPRPLLSHIPATVLSRRRMREGLDLDIGTTLTATLRDAIARITETLRRKLEDVRDGLRRFGHSTEELR